MTQGHQTTGRLPERSTAISGDETKGLTPMSAQQTNKPKMPPSGADPSQIQSNSKIGPNGPIGVLELLAEDF